MLSVTISCTDILSQRSSKQPSSLSWTACVGASYYGSAWESSKYGICLTSARVCRFMSLNPYLMDLVCCKRSVPASSHDQLQSYNCLDDMNVRKSYTNFPFGSSLMWHIVIEEQRYWTTLQNTYKKLWSIFDIIHVFSCLKHVSFLSHRFYAVFQLVVGQNNCWEGIWVWESKMRALFHCHESLTRQQWLMAFFSMLVLAS